jgi:DNA primase
MSMTDDPSRVFNVRAIHQAGDEIHVTEGEFDAIILSKIGLPAVAIPGAKAWKGHHRRMLAGFSRVYVWGDPDDAGAEFVQKVTRSLRSAKGVRLRGGDVTDTYLAGGADALLALIARKEEG